MLFLVRHAKAGDRLRDRHAEFERPLTKNGKRQAEALGAALIDAGATDSLYASPYARCLQTLEPLAKLLNSKVIADQRLREAQPFEPIIEWLAIAPEGAVLCSHGDLIPDVIAALERRACVITTEPHWAKASVWVLERNGEGTVIRASSWPPPNLD